jgi:hypothetical protein
MNQITRWLGRVGSDGAREEDIATLSILATFGV